LQAVALHETHAGFDEELATLGVVLIVRVVLLPKVAMNRRHGAAERVRDHGRMDVECVQLASRPLALLRRIPPRLSLGH